MEIYFITGNVSKLNEFKEFLPDIKQLDIDLPEIQDVDPKAIIKEKLKVAVDIKNIESDDFAIIVEDTSLFFECLNGLPGPLIKWFMKCIGNEGLFKLVEQFENKNAKAKTVIGYSDNKGNLKYFEGEILGKIIKPKGEPSFGWDPLFVPEGYDKSFAELGNGEKNKISMRKKAIINLKSFLENEKEDKKV